MIASRRKFIRNSSLAIAGTFAFNRFVFAAAAAGMEVGVQLYSVRDDMSKAPLDTLKKVAAMGYKNVEHANYVDGKLYGYTPSEFKRILDDLGLKMPSGHTVMGRQHWDAGKKQFTDLWKQTVNDAALLGQQYVIGPWIDATLRTTYDDLLRYMEVFNKSGELCQQHGVKFGYHNHDFEFNQKLNGIPVYDIILANTDPTLVVQQFDMGNLYNGGATATDIIKKYPGRFESLHVKDEIPATSGNDKYESCVLGKGIAEVKANLDFVKKAGGTKYLIVEQEAYQGQAPIGSIKDDLEIMKKWGYT